MKSQTILSIHIQIENELKVTGEKNCVNMVRFNGEANSDFFSGIVLPGGVDTQMAVDGKTHLSARYMLEGKDLTGTPCRIFIENEADLTDDKIITVPKIITDSKALAWLQYTELEGRIENEANGICIHICEKLCDFERSEYIINKPGKVIHGEFYKPVNTNNKTPIVIASHGYNSSSLQMRYEMEELTKRGVACYCYDFCGGGVNSKSSGKTTEMTIPSEINDLKFVYEEISALPFIDKENIYLYGMSQGGFVSALTAPDLKNNIKGLFLVFPAFCIPDDWADRRKNNKDEIIEFGGMTLGRCFADELPDYDVFSYASNYEGDVFIFHGECDPVVNVKYSEKLVKEYKNAELSIYPRQQHWFESKFTIATSGKIARIINDNLR